MPTRKLLNHQLLDQSFRTIRTLIKTVGWIFGGYFAWKSFESLSGQNTAFTLSLLADMKFTFTLTLAGAACAWAAVERTLRHKKTQYMQNRIIELEKKIDARRTSSNLTPKGLTNHRDLEK